MPIARVNSIEIHYEVAGQGDPLLMIMGFGADSRMWMLQTPAFSPHYRCITFDNRGVGHSSKPEGPYTMEQMAEEAVAVLDAAGAERAHVLGISMGGAIAQHVALKWPERVRSLVLASTWAARNAYLPRISDLGELVLAGGDIEALVRSSMLLLFTPKLFIEHPDMIGIIESQALEGAVDAEVFRAQRAAVFEHHTIDQLPSLDIPTLVMTAKRDVFVPPELSYQIADAIPGAQLVVLDSGHAYNFEEADAFNRTVLEFLATH